MRCRERQRQREREAEGGRERERRSSVEEGRAEWHSAVGVM